MSLILRPLIYNEIYFCSLLMSLILRPLIYNEIYLLLTSLILRPLIYKETYFCSLLTSLILRSLIYNATYFCSLLTSLILRPLRSLQASLFVVFSICAPRARNIDPKPDETRRGDGIIHIAYQSVPQISNDSIVTIILIIINNSSYYLHPDIIM